jgi:hypothetical protein
MFILTAIKNLRRHCTHLIKAGITLETRWLVIVCSAVQDHFPPKQQEYPKQSTVSLCRIRKLLLHSFHIAQGTRRYPANLQNNVKIRMQHFCDPHEIYVNHLAEY